MDLRRDYFHAVSSRVLRSSTCECINKTYLKESVSGFVFPSRSSKIKFWCGTGSLVALSRTEFEQIRNFDRYRIHGFERNIDGCRIPFRRMVKCCKCNANGTCRNCACVKSGSTCTVCAPGEKDRCRNSQSRTGQRLLRRCNSQIAAAKSIDSHSRKRTCKGSD